MEESLETFKALDPVAYLSKFTTSNTRPSSRPHHTTRPTTLLPSILTRNTHGSSLTTLGQTQIISAITLTIGTPPPSSSSSTNTPEGEIDLSISFSPLCGGQYNTAGRIMIGDTSESQSKTSAANAYSDPQSIGSYVKRVIVSSNMVDLTQLAVRRSNVHDHGSGASASASASRNATASGNQNIHAAWKVHVHCMVVNHDGNVVDALILGAVTALKDLILPMVKMQRDAVSGEEVVRLLHSADCDRHNNGGGGGGGDSDSEGGKERRKGKRLTFRKMCIPLTVGIFQGKMLVDPSMEEELLCDGMMTVVVDAMSLNDGDGDGDGGDDNDANMKDEDGEGNASSSNLTGDILSLSKSGGGILSTMEEIAACTQLAFGRAKELKSILL